MGPSALRIAGLERADRALGARVVDKGNLARPLQETREPGDPRRKYIGEIAHVCEALYEAASPALTGGALPLVLGGDHSLGAGSVAASAAARAARGAPLGLLWVDAHGDMNTPDSAASGNVHGMPVAALLGNEPDELASIGGFSPKVRPRADRPGRHPQPRRSRARGHSARRACRSSR